MNTGKLERDTHTYTHRERERESERERERKDTFLALDPPLCAETNLDCSLLFTITPSLSLAL
tara:strand:- start:302 stop:487 length:186 start_codon:yes stop_codon:yes gene_type:complete